MSGSESEFIKELDVNEVIVPEDRVTSYFDPEIHQEFLESIRAEGVKVPILVMEVEGKYYLIDGLHRLQACRELGIPKIKAVIKKGSMDDLLIENIISARLRGRENPAQTAKVVKILKDKHHYSWADIGRRLGMSPATAKIYYDITRLPDEVLHLVGSGQLSVNKARLLLDIPNPRDQVKAAQDIVRYGYSEGQARELVRYYLEAYFETPVTVKTKSEPTHGGPDIKCDVCGRGFDDTPTYYWVHPECMELLMRSYTELQEVKKLESTKEKSGYKQP
jgi:ParB/RepB/Spo0J family partition protein